MVVPPLMTQQHPPPGDEPQRPTEAAVDSASLSGADAAAPGPAGDAAASAVAKAGNGDEAAANAEVADAEDANSSETTTSETGADDDLQNEILAKSRGVRLAWQAGGFFWLIVGTVGIFLPLLPTTGPYILAAYCFARGNPVWEAKLLAHPTVGPHIRAWRQGGQVSRKGKIAATIAFAISIAMGLWLLHYPWNLIPVVVAVVILIWMWTRPEW